MIQSLNVRGSSISLSTHTNTWFSGRFYDIIADYQLNNNDVPRAMYFAETGLKLSVSSRSTRGQSDLLATLAWIKWMNGDYSAAQVHAYESQRLARISAHLFKEAWALRLECMCWYGLGRYDHSLSLANRAIDLLGCCGMSGGQLHHALVSDLAEVHRFKSEYLDARNIHIQRLDNISMQQNPYDYGFCLLNISEIDVEIDTSKDEMQNNIQTAGQLFGAEAANSREMAFRDMIQASLDLREGNFLAAKTGFRNCLESTWGSHVESRTYCLEKLADVSCWGARDGASFGSTVTFFVHSLKLKQKLETHKALQFLGRLYLADSDRETAISLLMIALEGFTQMDVHRSKAECMLQLGDISEMDENIGKAAELWATARPLFQRSSQVKQIAHIDERLAGMKRRSQDQPGNSVEDSN
jgi:tetratricopeptide (TPR) repeat protein